MLFAAYATELPPILYKDGKYYMDKNMEYQNHPLYGPLVRIAMKDLITLFGSNALPVTYRALERMRHADDSDGLAIWLAIHAELVGNHEDNMNTGSGTIH